MPYPPGFSFPAALPAKKDEKKENQAGKQESLGETREKERSEELDPARVANEELKRENILNGVAIRDACLNSKLESELRNSALAIYAPQRLRDLLCVPAESPLIPK